MVVGVGVLRGHVRHGPARGYRVCFRSAIMLGRMRMGRHRSSSGCVLFYSPIAASYSAYRSRLRFCGPRRRSGFVRVDVCTYPIRRRWIGGRLDQSSDLRISVVDGNSAVRVRRWSVRTQDSREEVAGNELSKLSAVEKLRLVRRMRDNDSAKTAGSAPAPAELYSRSRSSGNISSLESH